MKFDIFFSICQTEVNGYTPNEKQMFQNFFNQMQLADAIGFGTAWVAETHLSCQIQKLNADAVIPHFRGEIGLNTDILQLAHFIFDRTQKINIGSAIRNILCNGGPIAHAEAVKTFLTLHSFRKNESRNLEFGFAAGRFPFSNTPYGIRPRNDFEVQNWNEIRSLIFHQAAEIFMRLLKNEVFSIQDVQPIILQSGNKIESYWNFDKVGVLPFEAPFENLKLTVGSHDPAVQKMVNQYLPVGVFNLSITPPEVIEQTHAWMQQHYHPTGGNWQRSLMPRTVLIFIDSDSKAAKAQALSAWKNYWLAMEKTLDPKKVENAVENTIAGNPQEVTEALRQKYHSEDRLMMWFDFNNHNSEQVEASMKLFADQVMPQLS